jgi:2-dehydropantoate 2-reductase
MNAGPMRLVIYGAGAVGGVIGAQLHAAGHEVLLIARGAHLEAVRERGLCLITAGGRATHRVPAVGHPSEAGLGPGDVVLLTMKTQHTAAALADLRACGDLDLPVICAQNGVENERIAARLFRRVYGMVVWLPATFVEPGHVIAYSAPALGCLDAGIYPRGVDDTITAVTSALDASGFGARPDAAILRWKYNKLLSNLINALMAVLGPQAPFGPFARQLREEALACYAAAGIDFASDEEEAVRREETGVGIVEIEGQPRIAGSSWQSLARGTGNIETDFLNGEIALLGRLHGVPTPYNRALQRAAARVVAGGEGPGSLSLEALEALVKAET